MQHEHNESQLILSPSDDISSNDIEFSYLCVMIENCFLLKTNELLQTALIGHTLIHDLALNRNLIEKQNLLVWSS